MIRETPEGKLGILDLRANVGDKTTVNIEIQMVNPKNMFKRLLWYWARIYSAQLKRAEEYSELKKTITILIVNYEIEEFEYYKDAHTVWNLLEDRNTEIKPFEDIQIHVIELPKIKKYQNAIQEGLIEWLEFLSNPESEEAKMGKEKNEELIEAYRKLEYISGDEDLRRKVDLELMVIMDERYRNKWYAEKEKEFTE